MPVRKGERNRSLTRDDLARVVADSTGLHLKQVSLVMQTLFDQIPVELYRGHRIIIRGFGVFDSYMTKARKGNKPITKEPIFIKPRRIVRFRPGVIMKEGLEARTERFDEV